MCDLQSLASLEEAYTVPKSIWPRPNAFFSAVKKECLTKAPRRLSSEVSPNRLHEGQD